jgi:hypothetical protein
MNRSYSKIRHIQESNQKLERRIMSEQQTVERTHADAQLVDKVFADIKTAMSGLGTDEDGILSALYKLSPNTSGAGWEANVAQKRKDYEYLMQLIKKEGFNSIIDWIKTELSDVAKHNDPLGLAKFTHGNDLKVLQGAQKLEDLLSGKNDSLSN